jgi:hypothetical protein
MEDVLEVYHRPYDPLRPVVCLDERPKTLRGTPRGGLLPRPGRAARQDYEYERHGSCNVFLCVEPLVGKRQVSVTQRRTLLDFADQLRRLSDDLYPEVEKIVLVLDNLNTHTAAALYERFSPAQARRIASRFEWHYTPEHGSWLNMAECELSVLSRQCLGRRMATIEEVAQEVAAWQARRGQLNATIRWQFSTADARIKLRRLYPEIREHN